MVATSSAPVRARPARTAARTSRVVSSARVRAVVATSSVRGRAPLVATSSVRGRAPLVATSSVRGRAPLVATSSAPVRARPARTAARTSRVVSSARVRAVVATSSVRGRAPLVAAPAALRSEHERHLRRQRHWRGLVVLVLVGDKRQHQQRTAGLGSRRPARPSFQAARR